MVGLSTSPSPTPRPYAGFARQFIGGRWQEGHSTRRLEDRNPYNGEVLVELKQASREDVDAAYEAARRAQPDWGAALPSVRSEVLHAAVDIMKRRREEIIDWLVREAGSTRLKAAIEWDSALKITREAASFPYRVEGRILASDVPDKESRVYRQPLGVVAVISPWNFPLHLTARSLCPALALGNAVVVKPASDTPVTGALLLARILEEAGLPEGVLSCVVGTGSEIGDYFVEHPVPRLISFTGSTAVGKGIGRIAAGGRMLKRVALELGGNSPLVVLDDADLETAVHAAVVGRFLHQGEICMSVNRIIVDATLYDEFVERFAARVRALPMGDPARPETVIGPIINQAQLDGLLAKVEDAGAQGARQVVGGEPEGLVLPPHVFADVQPDASLAREETFGPLAPVLKAKDETHALTLANATDYGLASAVFSGDVERGVRFAQRVVAGMTHVNDISVEDEPNAPFGGEKNSGLGRFGGDWAIAEFTRDHWITVQHRPRSYPF